MKNDYLQRHEEVVTVNRKNLEQLLKAVQEELDFPVDSFYLGRRKTPTFRRNVCSVSEEASVSERPNEQGKPL